MNLDFDMVKAAAPLILLAIWALSSLFKTETKREPGRPQGMGPRPGGPPLARPAPRPGPATARDPAALG